MVAVCVLCITIFRAFKWQNISCKRIKSKLRKRSLLGEIMDVRWTIAHKEASEMKELNEHRIAHLELRSIQNLLTNQRNQVIIIHNIWVRWCTNNLK